MRKILFFAISLIAVSAFAATVVFKVSPLKLLKGGGDEKQKALEVLRPLAPKQTGNIAATNVQRQVKPGETVAEWGGKPELRDLGTSQKWYVYPDGTRMSEDGTMTATPISEPTKVVENPDGTKSLVPVTKQEFIEMMRKQSGNDQSIITDPNQKQLNIK